MKTIKQQQRLQSLRKQELISQAVESGVVDKVNKLIDSLKNETYSPKPARRVYIPKKNGKKRPLGIPAFADKLGREKAKSVLQ